MLPYSDRLSRFAHWFVQLWAESLGKNGQGTTPLACLGPVDQHSQLQLFMDGPREHLITVVRTPTAGKDRGYPQIWRAWLGSTTSAARPWGIWLRPRP